MERSGLTIVLMAAACWMLAGCSANRNAGPEQSLTASSRMDVAVAAEESGDKQTAASMYLAAANEAQGDSTIQLRCAEGLARNGKLEDADAILARRLRVAPRDMDLLGTLGGIQVMEGKPEEAVETLSGVLRTKPDDVKALVNKAVALDILHRHATAQALYRQALALAPHDAVTSNDLALSLLLSGQPEAGAQVLAQFRESESLPERIRTNLGIMDAASGHADDAHTLLGSRIGAADLAALTQAISSGTAGTGQP